MFPYILYGVFFLVALGLYFLYRKAMVRVKNVVGMIPFTKDISMLVERHEADPVIGRDEEMDRTIHILMRRTKNNPLLIGKPGVGKTSIVEGLAARIYAGNVPSALKRKRVLELDLLALLSDTKLRGDLEARLRNLIDALDQRSEETILFVDEIHRIQQSGGAEGALNISDSLKPLLTKGRLQVIGATTWDEYNHFVRPDQAFDRRFQIVLVDEPTPEVALIMLQHLRPIYELHHGVKISDDALSAAVNLSDEKIDHRYLPDKAIDLIDEAAAKVSITCQSKFATHLGVVHAAATQCEDMVEEKDIQDVIDQWITHDKQDEKRDPRTED